MLGDSNSQGVGAAEEFCCRICPFTCKPVGSYKVLEGQDIAPFKCPDFGCYGHGPESSYKELVENAQLSFSEYEQTGSVKENPSAHFGFFFGSERVVVCKTISGQYHVINGLHRAFVARKYGLKLLVYVEEEQEEQTN